MKTKTIKKKNRKLLFLPYKKTFFDEVPDGWKDLGQMNPMGIVKNGKEINTYKVHSLCNTILNVGKWDDKLFKFCPRCKVVIYD
jgi:hypothetical protein